jgi:protein TonB
MHNQIAYFQPQTNLSALLPFAIPAAIVTMAIFVGMQQLIENKQIPRVEPIPTPIIHLLAQIDEPKTIEKQPLRPKPKPKPVPKPTVKLEPAEPTPKWAPGPLVNTLHVPKITNTMNSELALPDGGARPIVRIQPKYPISAAKDGIQGWVKLLFSISTSGNVENIQIADAKPKRIFNSAAKKALSKWKYKPNIVDGQAQRQEGLSVMLEFTLDSL